MTRLIARGLTVLGAVALAAGLAPTTASADASTVTENLSVPIQLQAYVECANGGAGEWVELSGMLHILFHVTANDQGFHVKYHAQPQGVAGEGLTTGDKYQGTGVTQGQFNLTNGATEGTFVNNFRLIGQGRGNNLLVHANFHFTINANGDLTAVPGNFSAECK